MRVGIVGGGAAGLVSAWLLESEHDVTLFEKDDRLGGHAHTTLIEAHGERIDVDAGFQFFADASAYAMFNRLLDLLGVARRSYPATLTVFHTGRRQRPVVMPPLRNGIPVWGSLTPRALCSLIRFRRFLKGIPEFLAQRDTTLTIGEYLERQRLPKAFTDEFLIPLLLSFWCTERDEFLRFAAYNALVYLGANLPNGLTPPDQSEIPGGMRVYIDALTGTLKRTRVRLGATIRQVSREGDGYRITDADGIGHAFDHVVLATPAWQAAALIGSAPELEPVCRQLRRFEYFDTTIAIHGDRGLMPRRRSAWSVVNARWDGRHSSLSIWSPARDLPVFKSWVTFDDRLPDPLYAVVEYQHGKITPEYFDAQQRLKALQGHERLWLAGLYADDADSHESAIRSAVTVARHLAPGSPRLTALLADPAGSA